MMMRQPRIIRLLLLLLPLLLMATAIALLATSWHGHSPQTPELEQQQPKPPPPPPPPPPSTALARHCGIQGNFTQAAVDAVCAAASEPEGSPGPAPPAAACRVSRIDHLDQSGFVQARLRLDTGSTVKIFVFPPSDLISGHILRRGVWEAPNVRFMTRALRALPGSALLDIGSGLGVFSLHAAKAGRKVVAIDANYQNAIRLAKSVHSNGYSNLVQVYLNAVSTLPAGSHMYMRIPPDCNVGGGEPLPQPEAPAGPPPDPRFSDHIRVRAAGLDLLVAAASAHLHGASGVFVKLDIEGHEWGAFATGGRLFNGWAGVPMVMMEWKGTVTRRPEKIDFVANFFAAKRYLPYALKGDNVLNPLQPQMYESWPGDILWVRNATQLLASLRS